VDALLAQGHRVRGVDSFSDYYARELKERNLEQALRSPDFDLVEADVATADLGPLLDGIEGVFHLAAQPGVRGSWGDAFAVYLHDNVLATQALLEHLARRDIRLVFASSSSIYGNTPHSPTSEQAPPAPISPYGVTKLTCEHLVQAYEPLGLRCVTLRYFTVFGPRQRPDMALSRLLSKAVQGDVFTLYGTGEQSRDFTYVSDAVSATILAMQAPAGATYNVGGGNAATLAEVVKMVEEATGTALRVEYRPAASGDVDRTAADTRRLREELGWRPAVRLPEGLRNQLAWVRKPEATLR
jgi:UDP-glucuronate 4-epimerase